MNPDKEHSAPAADDHVHLFFDGSSDPARRRTVAALSEDAALARALTLLERYREAGILKVRDGGDPRGLALEVARLAGREPQRYAALEAPGFVIRREGRYGSFLGKGVETLAEARALIEKNARSGATHTKVLATGANSLDCVGVVGERQFTENELTELVAASRANGLKVMIHANGPLAWVLKARPDTVEHGFGLTLDDLRAFADQGISWTPTLSAWEEIVRLPELTPAQREVVRVTASRQRLMVAKASELGVKVALGSDAGTPGVDHVDGTFTEAKRLAQAKISGLETLQPEEATG